MSPAFTPGPWASFEGGTYVDGTEDFVRGVCIQGRATDAMIGDPSAWICEVPAEACESEANARLIAAAPELFNGCSALLGLIQLIRGRTDLPSDLQLALDDDNHRIIEAQQALAKAQGHD